MEGRVCHCVSTPPAFAEADADKRRLAAPPPVAGLASAESAIPEAREGMWRGRDALWVCAKFRSCRRPAVPAEESRKGFDGTPKRSNSRSREFLSGLRYSTTSPLIPNTRQWQDRCPETSRR